MTAITGRRRTRIAAVLAATAVAGGAAAILAGTAAAQPPVVSPGGPAMTCTFDSPGQPHVVIIEKGRGPLLGTPAPPLEPGVALPGCPDLDGRGPIVVAPAQPGRPQLHIEHGGPGVTYSEPAQIGTGSSGS